MIRLSLAIAALPNLCHITFEDEWPFRSLEYDLMSCWKPSASKGYLKHLLWTVICMESRIRRLELPLCGPGDMLREFAGKESARLEWFLDGIEELSLRVQNMYEPSQRRRWEKSGDLSRFLQSVHHLTRLELRGLVRVGPVLEPVTFLQLKYLDLSLTVDGNKEKLNNSECQSLVRFLERHVSKLEAIRLGLDTLSLGQFRHVLLRVLPWKHNLKPCWVIPGTSDGPRIGWDIHNYALGRPWTTFLTDRVGPEPVEEGKDGYVDEKYRTQFSADMT